MRFPGLLGALALLGCASTDPNNGNAAGASSTGGNTGSGGSGATGGGSLCLSGPGYADSTPPQRVGSLSARLVDLDDQPLPFEFVQLCGTDICIPGKSTESGSVSIGANEDITKPAFKFGEGKVSARFARLLPNELQVDFGTVRSVRLPDLDTGVPLLAGISASSGGLTLTPASDGQIKLDRLTFGEAEEQRLRAVAVPLDRAGDLIDVSLGLELLYAATPTSTEFCPPAKLQLENSEGWAAGTEVEVLLHGVEIDEAWAPYGGWAKVSDARVSDDGASIETTEPGLPLLGVLGLRRK